MFDVEYTYLVIVALIIVIFYFVTKEPEFNPPPEPTKIVGDFTL